MDPSTSFFSDVPGDERIYGGRYARASTSANREASAKSSTTDPGPTIFEIDTSRPAPARRNPVQHHTTSAPQTPTSAANMYGNPYTSPGVRIPGKVGGFVNHEGRIDMSTSGRRLQRRATAGAHPSSTKPLVSSKEAYSAPTRGNEHPDPLDVVETQEQYRQNKQGVAQEPYEVDEEDDFDPQAPVDIFDYKTQLEDEWDKIQVGMEETLKGFAEKTLSHAYDTIFEMCHILNQLETEARDALIQGIDAIKVEEAKHEQARATITDFAKEMERIALMLQNYRGNKGHAGIKQ
ncbi:hypothetical protein IAU60_002045 [Kwoniella sp. DSM 27419]